MVKQNLLNDIPERVDVIGIPISVVNMQTCTNFIFKNIENIKGNYICVSNAHTCVIAHDDSNYRNIQTNSVLSIPDGKPLSIVGKRKYPEMDRVTGPDLMRKILEISNGSNNIYKHYFYGTSKENIEALIKKIKNDYPNVIIAGYEPSVFRELTDYESEQLINRVNESGADFLWVALGAPKQEIFCSKMEGKINSLMIGVGGAFNVVSGVISECPIWMQKICMEWFYRFLKEPKRLFKRYLVTNTKFIFYLFFKRSVKNG